MKGKAILSPPATLVSRRCFTEGLLFLFALVVDSRILTEAISFLDFAEVWKLIVHM